MTMTVPSRSHLKRSRGSFARNHRLCPHPRQRIHEADPSIIAPPDSRSSARRPLTTNYQSQSLPVAYRHRNKRRRLSASCTSVLQNHLPFPSHPKPVFPTPPSSSSSSPPPSSPQTDEEDRLSVISERLRLKMTNSSFTTAHGKNPPTGQVCTYEDWQDIKELFAKAAEQYNGKHVPNISNPASPMHSPNSLLLLLHSVTNAFPKYKASETDAVEVMPLLRAVIHECHRFLLFYPDPSELIMQPLRPSSPEPKACKRPGNSSPSLRQCSQNGNGKDATRPEEPATLPKEAESPRSDLRLAPAPSPTHFSRLTVPIHLRNNRPRSMQSLESPCSSSAT